MKRIWLSQLRNYKTGRKEFRRLVRLVSEELACSSGDELTVKDSLIKTPIGYSQESRIETPIVLVPIFRSGLTLLPAFLEAYPEASVACLGIKRDEETAEPHFYYSNLPKISGEETAIILDPMLATGGTAVAVVELLKKSGLKGSHIRFEGIIASEEGVAHLKKQCPEVNCRVVAIDAKLTPNKFIDPGLGDFGDRYFGT